MEATLVLKQLRGLGIQVTVVGDRLQLRPGSAIPPELIPEIKEHKSEIMSLLRMSGYRLKYQDGQAAMAETEEIAARVIVDGYVLLWSTSLCDLIAFYRDEEARHSIPPGFIPYSLVELTELFGQKKQHSEHALKLIHEAKRQGARVKGRDPGDNSA